MTNSNADSSVRVVTGLDPLDYLGKFISYEHLNPVLHQAGTRHGAVIGVLVTLPGLNLPTELLVGIPGEEPDFLSLDEIRLAKVSSEPPKDCA